MSTKLDIINAMLVAVQEAPVTSETSMHPSAVQARAWLDSNNKQLQQRGWWFNTEYNVTLSPNDANKIILPSGTLGVIITSTPSYYVKRGRYLYNPVQHTFEFDSAVLANIKLLLDLDDLPSTAAMFLQAKCVYDFYVHEGGGDSNTIRKCLGELIDAKARLTESELREAKVNAFASPLTASLITSLPGAGVSYNPTYPGGG